MTEMYTNPLTREGCESLRESHQQEVRWRADHVADYGAERPSAESEISRKLLAGCARAVHGPPHRARAPAITHRYAQCGSVR